MSKITTAEFKKEIAELKKSLAQQIDLQCTNLSSEPAAKKQRLLKSHKHFSFFCTTYLPHYFPNENRSSFQNWAFSNFPISIRKKDGIQHALAAPRGESKSTIASVALPLWLVACRLKRFIVLVSESSDQANLNLAAIQVELESNPRLKMDFPKIVGISTTWQQQTIITKNQVMIKTAGAGKRIRGWRFGAFRPDLIVLDDLENDTNVRSKPQRDSLENWIDNTVLPMGPPDGSMDCIYVGTILHYDSVLNRKINSKTWQIQVFKAIERWPERMDLWDEWEQHFITGDSDQFLAQNKHQMLRGAHVSWQLRPLERLMKLRVGKHRAFDREYQNDPGLDEQAPFKNITIWQNIPSNVVYYGAVDPSMGKNKKTGDPSAIIVGAFDRPTMTLYTVVEDIARRPPLTIINKILEYQKQFKCMIWGIESVQFQEFFRLQLIEKANAEGIPMPARALIPHTDKNLRIESLQPYLENKQIQLKNPQSTLYSQLRYWPEADHDDGPDALHMLWMIASTNAGGIPNILSTQTKITNG